MTAAKELRRKFLDYFERHGHRVVASSSLVPLGDDTLMFSNAGMVQFKGVFTGEDRREYHRAATSQKCLRVSGKHNDLDNVGYTARHHTFFEMLGNFSFGDYFKHDAIRFGWEFLTGKPWAGLDPSRLHITVFEKDDEAYDIWRNEIGIAAERIGRSGEKDNFWSMGDTGPCGPCSEIHFDQGPGHWKGCPDPAACSPACDCDRFLEIWNLVFMQFERHVDGRQTSLPNPSIDTGMGLERLAAVVQGVKSNYETDLFTPIIARIGSLAGKKYGRNDADDTAMRVVADHVRATTFLIADGVLPSNEGRGYVWRRIFRRAVRYGRKLGYDRPMLAQVAQVVIDEYASAYPELRTQQKTILEIFDIEEAKFLETLDHGLELHAKVVARLRQSGEKTFPGDEAFKLYDTYGFPVDLTRRIAEEEGLTLDEGAFSESMEAQRERAREAGKKGGAAMSEDLSVFPPTRFVGYETLETEAHVLAVHPAGAGAVHVVLDVSPFYAEGGGQIADMGQLVRKSGETIQILNVQKPDGKHWVHTVASRSIAAGETLHARVGWDHRRETRRHHTATHLLQAALRDVLGGHVQQAGSLVEPGRLRFDFSHHKSVSVEEMERIEQHVRQAIARDEKLRIEEMPFDDARKRGALAFFGEKYGSVVRVVEVPGISTELCGGTHVERTGEIGDFIVTQETGVAAGVRRIEAKVSEAAAAELRGARATLTDLAAMLKVSSVEIAARVRKLTDDVAAGQARIRELEQQLAVARASGASEQKTDIDGIELLVSDLGESSIKAMKAAADALRQKLSGLGIALLTGLEDGKLAVVVTVTKDLQGELGAGTLIKEIGAAIGARGGGNPQMAQAGGGDAALQSKVDELARSAIEKLRGAAR